MTTEINLDLEVCVLTDKAQTKTLPCRNCGRPCVVTQFASPNKTECTFCRKGLTAPEAAKAALTAATTNGDDPGDDPVPAEVVPEFDEDLTPEVLTDRDKTKDVPCRSCRRRCTVTTFATPAKVECSTCRGEVKTAKREKSKQDFVRTHSVDPAKLENLFDGLLNPAFKSVPPCPFDAEHYVELKSITHSPNYGPRQLTGYEKGQPMYNQETGESVIYQCNECKCVISYSTMHQYNMMAQNEPRDGAPVSGVLASIMGVRDD